MTARYHDVRFTPDPRRKVLWRALWRHYFSRQISPNDCVLDIGCGYGAFINEVVARRRIALDSWSEFARYLDPGVEAIVGSAVEVGSLVKGQVDFALASNLFEHLRVSPFRRMLLHLPSGQLGMHGLRDDNRLITEFSAADMMLLCRPVAPMLESKRDVTF
jgi:hypothetical protein